MGPWEKEEVLKFLCCSVVLWSPTILDVFHNMAHRIQARCAQKDCSLKNKESKIQNIVIKCQKVNIKMCIK